MTTKLLATYLADNGATVNVHGDPETVSARLFFRPDNSTERQHIPLVGYTGFVEVLALMAASAGAGDIYNGVHGQFVLELHGFELKPAPAKPSLFAEANAAWERAKADGMVPASFYQGNDPADCD